MFTIHVTITEPITLKLADLGQFSEILTQLADIKQRIKEIKMTQQEVTDLLNKIDTTTTKIAGNVQIIANVDQTISDEIDVFLKANPSGTVLTDAMVAQLQLHADNLQKSSDASDAQVAVLQAIAAKGAPVVPPPPPPPAIG